MRCKTLIIWILIASCAVAEKGGVYKLRTSTGQGSCVAISTPADNRLHFLTIEHALKGGDLRAIVNGQSLPCEAVIRWPARPEPIILIRTVDVYQGSARTYPIASDPLSVSRRVYVVGFAGGEYLGLQSEIVDVQTAHDSYYVTAGTVEPGASGGAVLSDDGELVGIVTSISRARNETLSTNVVAATRRFRSTERVQWQCGPRGCFPSVRYSGRYKVIERGSAGILGRGYERYVESGPQSVTPAPPPVTVVPSVDYDKLAAIVIERYGDQLRGEDGLPGIDGKDGETPQIDVSHLAEVIVDRYADRLRGPQGPPGPVVSQPRSQRVVLTNDGKIIDDETYHDGEPIVLDIRKLRVTRD